MALGLRNAMRVSRFGEGMKKALEDSLVIGNHERKAHIKIRQPQSWYRGGRFGDSGSVPSEHRDGPYVPDMALQVDNFGRIFADTDSH